MFVTQKSREKKHSQYQHDPIVDVDFVWEPGKRLKDCIGLNDQLEFAIASHVLEHVPDPLSWINEVLECIRVEGELRLALPLKQSCFDATRSETDIATLIDSWIMQRRIPSAFQLVDFCVNSTGDPNRPISPGARLREAFAYAIHSHTTGEYLDAHCSVFSPDSFEKIIANSTSLGIINAGCTITSVDETEFFVTLSKIGDPVYRHPGLGAAISFGQSAMDHINHMNRAWSEAQAALSEAQAALSEAQAAST